MNKRAKLLSILSLFVVVITTLGFLFGSGVLTAETQPNMQPERLHHVGITQFANCQDGWEASAYYFGGSTNHHLVVNVTVTVNGVVLHHFVRDEIHSASGILFDVTGEPASSVSILGFTRLYFMDGTLKDENLFTTNFSGECWDKSSVSVTGECTASGVVFTVTNTGEKPMTGTTNWRLYQNNALVDSGTLQLAGFASQQFTFTLAGTLRLEVDQRPGHPGSSLPNAVVENNCLATTPTSTPTDDPSLTPTESPTLTPTLPEEDEEDTPTPTATSTLSFTLTPSNTPSGEVTPTPDMTFVPSATATPSVNNRECKIPESGSWTIPPNELFINGLNMIGFNDMLGVYTIFWFDGDQFPIGSVFEVRLSNGELFTRLTYLGGDLCISEPGERPTPPPPCDDLCIVHQDEVLVEDVNGNLSMQAVIWDWQGGAQRVIVSTAPFNVICSISDVVTVDVIYNSYNGVDYYLWLGDPDCLPEDHFVNYGACVLTPDLNNPYWFNADDGSIAVFPGQASSELEAALRSVDVEEDRIQAFLSSIIQPGFFTGSGWYPLTQ